MPMSMRIRILTSILMTQGTRIRIRTRTSILMAMGTRIRIRTSTIMHTRASKRTLTTTRNMILLSNHPHGENPMRSW